MVIPYLCHHPTVQMVEKVAVIVLIPIMGKEVTVVLAVVEQIVEMEVLMVPTADRVHKVNPEKDKVRQLSVHLTIKGMLEEVVLLEIL